MNDMTDWILARLKLTILMWFLFGNQTAFTKVIMRTTGFSTCIANKNNIQCFGKYAHDLDFVKGKYKEIRNFDISEDRVCVIDSDGLKCKSKDPLDPTLNVPLEIDSPEKVVLGSAFACSLQSRRVICWGHRNSESKSVLDVPKFLKKVSDLAAGNDFACALQEGNVYCWGHNPYGSDQVPKGLRNVRLISASNDSACAVHETGLTCWGLNAPDSSILEIPNLNDEIKEVSIGQNHSCVLLKSNEVRCWTSKDIDGNVIENLTQPPIFENSVYLISSGLYVSCALTSDGLRCWGIRDSFIPNKVGRIEDISGTFRTTCAITSSGLECWGQEYVYDDLKFPKGLKNLTAISSTLGESCVLSDGRSVCWGTKSSFSQTFLDKLGKIETLSLAYQAGCAIKDKKVHCWSHKSKNPLLNVPTYLKSVNSIAVESESACAVQENGNVFCWGNNDNGQTNVPKLLNKVKKVSISNSHTCAIKTNGDLVCWGDNSKGQLNIPSDLHDVIDVATSGNDTKVTCAIDQKKGVRCWGNQNLSQDTGLLNIPSNLVKPTRIISFNDLRMCVIDVGTMKCWGYRDGFESDVPNIQYSF